MAVIGVNWDDVNPNTINLDLVKLGIATSVTDDCSITDLWDGTTQNINGSTQVFPDVAPHAHIAKMIKCLPF